MSYDFNKQLSQGIIGENFLDSVFSPCYQILPASYQQQRQGIDRVFVNLDEDIHYLIEYKTDKRAVYTGNCFVETTSVDTANKLGWAYTSQADRLIYFLPQSSKVYLINLSELRSRLPVWKQHCPTRVIPNRNYNTCGLLVPLPAIEQCCEGIWGFDAVFKIEP